MLFIILLASFLLLLKDEANGGHSPVTGPKRRLKVLVYSPSLSFSHAQFLGAIADTLQEAGHEVHLFKYVFDRSLLHKNETRLVSRVHLLEPLESGQAKDISFTETPAVKNSFQGSWPTFNFMDHMILHQFLPITTIICEEVLRSTEMLDRLGRERFDVAIGEMYDNCAVALFHRIGVKTTMAAFAVPLVQMNARRFGIPGFASFMPNFMVPNTNPLESSFISRLMNFYNEFYDWYNAERLYKQAMKPFYEQILGLDFPSMEELIRNVSLIFVNSNPFFEMPRPITSKVIHIGGISERNAPKEQKLDQKTQQILDGAMDGAVLLSFGSIADTRQMSREMRGAILRAFGRFPSVQFLWKLDAESRRNESSLFASSPNVHSLEWVQQTAVLKHPNMRAFITHCGQNSLTEAAREGVPLIGVPLFGDQLYNSMMARKMGLALHLDVAQLNEPGGEQLLAEALEKILHEPIYREKARLISKKLALSPFSPAENLVRWVEFAAEFPELNELNLPGEEEMGWFVYYSLDAISLTLFILLSLAWLAWKCANLILPTFFFLQ